MTDNSPQTILEVIHSRRSVRKFLPDPVPREVLAQIAAAGQEAPSGCNMQAKAFIVIDEPDIMDRIREFTAALASAPAAVVLVIEPKATTVGEFWVQDASAAMENMLLAAAGLGYGACWVEGAVRRHEDELRNILNVAAHLRVWSLTPIGKPAEIPERPPKPTPDDVTHYNAFPGQ